VTTKLTVPGGAGCDAAAKIASIVAGMLTGADSIDDLDVLREGAVHKVLPGVKAPSTLGTFLRAFTFGHVRQMGAVAAGFLVALAGLVPLLTGHDDHREAVTWLDVDDTMRETHGYGKQGRHRRSAHLRRQHHRDRHRLLPAGPHYKAKQAAS
jgi:hypothetical protein